MYVCRYIQTYIHTHTYIICQYIIYGDEDPVGARGGCVPAAETGPTCPESFLVITCEPVRLLYSLTIVFRCLFCNAVISVVCRFDSRVHEAGGLGIHTYTPAYTHAYLPTYIPTYIHTYLPTLGAPEWGLSKCFCLRSAARYHDLFSDISRQNRHMDRQGYRRLRSNGRTCPECMIWRGGRAGEGLGGRVGVWGGREAPANS